MSRNQPKTLPEPRWIELDTSLAETEAVDEWDGGRVDLETERPLEEVGEDRSWVKPLVLCLSPLAAFAFGGLLVLVIPRSSAVQLAVEPEREAPRVPQMDEVDESPGAPVGAASAAAPLPPFEVARPARPARLEPEVSEPVLASSARVHRPPPPPHFGSSASRSVDPAAASTRSGAERRGAAEPSPSPTRSETEAQPEARAPAAPSGTGPSEGHEPALPGATPAPVRPDASPIPDSADTPASSSSDPTSVYADLPEYPS